MPDLRNPIVARTLTELRKVVNGIIREHGLPDAIHVELARELRQSPKQRDQTVKRIKANERARQKAAEELLAKEKIETPSRDDIEKYLLAEECNWECPYTGKPISVEDLFGSHPSFDVEHVIPFSRCLDNSFLNKTLCDAEENRRIKQNRTPHEAYAHTGRWPDILDRVKRFQGHLAVSKLRRFKLDEKGVEALTADFTARQLNDTRWASVWAKRYLGLLYGGVNGDGVDASGKRRVFALSGPATAYLRRIWGLNGILGDGETKTRDDHRHHAVDAVVIAMTGPGAVKALSDAAVRASVIRTRLFEQTEPPWEGFREDVRDAVGGIVVSHAVERRVRGQLHKETFYGAPRKDENGKECVTVRKPLWQLSAREAQNIVDPAVRAAVLERLEQAGGDCKKAFADAANLPVLRSRDGASIPIRRVRCRVVLETFNVGSQTAPRYVQSERNHHMAVYAVKGTDGSEKWEGEEVSMFEAYRRKREGLPVVDRRSDEKRRFLFSIAGGDTIELERNGTPELFVVRTVPKSKQILFVPATDARTLKEIGKTGLTALPETLRRWKCQKKSVSPLGLVLRDNS